ncbi:MAG: hypothetical protein ACLP01_14510 [Solirubrobacteraceae bacterium]
MASRSVATTALAAFLLGVGMYASIAVIPALVEIPKRTGFGFGGTAIAAGLFMLPTAAVQLLVGLNGSLGSATSLGVASISSRCRPRAADPHAVQVR